ncbi:MAG TPA: fasciclin domain-containing protein [Rhodothermales bacterium]|nr:fasciclin domain-containing protein [Rhodothermales bacterium]
MKTFFTRATACTLFALLLFALPLYAQDNPDTPTPETMEPANTIVDVAAEAGTFATLLAALDAADLTNALRGEGPFTVFAPTDEAFAQLPEGKLEKLLKPENKDKLVALLSYHIVNDQAKASDTEATTVTTLGGNDLSITPGGEALMVNEATVITPDIEASNGVIHIIDTVLMPPAKEKVKMEEEKQ